jgi:hypothetical protein
MEDALDKFSLNQFVAAHPTLHLETAAPITNRGRVRSEGVSDIGAHSKAKPRA